MQRETTILAIDAGNSRVKWAVHDGRRFIHDGWRALADIDALEADWSRLATPESVVIANVAGQTVQERLSSICMRWRLNPRWVTGMAAQCGVANRYDDPAQLGPDRWAALIAAHSLNIGSCLVICTGTATTVDALTAQGEFLGGLILPGLDLMHDALTAGTARLSAERGSFSEFPRSTRDAIATGAIQAACGAIERMRTLMASAGHAQPIVVATGGAAGILARYLEHPVQVRDRLILEGLVTIAGVGQ